ncbi:hypothetical protein MM221_19720 [Salipaludibacillus sp. LMS25]|jgi:cytochrome bd-type quinol oxidase subunit 2|uniref:hypothetical protein n=1 Tax=Salipaludibacillus sp. LMS25 TaxID=2924031 RepID=UPI0020D000CC|nr:hypothetical protein [Salipaludibacillus sp. LMS25]UTR14746.1 hypothetical protein MM221_19720 [Salipaludibacillus sp. LMS25]
MTNTITENEQKLPTKKNTYNLKAMIAITLTVIMLIVATERFPVSLLLSVVAIIFSIMSLVELRTSTQKGKILAVISLVVNSLLLLVTIGLLVYGFVLYQSIYN